MKLYINYYLLEKWDFGKDFQEIHRPLNLRPGKNSKQLNNFQIQKRLCGQPDPDLKFGHN